MNVFGPGDPADAAQRPRSSVDGLAWPPVLLGPAATYDRLAQFGFDPQRDFRIDEQGVWQWASERPELHAFLENYFKDRQEDELPATAAG